MTADAGDSRDPQPADRHHLDQLRAATERAAATAEPLSSPHAGAPAALLDRAEQAVEAAGPDLLALSADLHAHPEEGYADYVSTEGLTREATASVVSLSGGAVLANVVSVVLLVVETVSFHRR